MIQKIRQLGALFGRREGLAQIPIMVALLLMAVAVPAVTKLVQQNQDTRNLAYVDPGGGGSTTAPTRPPATKPPATRVPTSTTGACTGICIMYANCSAIGSVGAAGKCSNGGMCCKKPAGTIVVQKTPTPGNWTCPKNGGFCKSVTSCGTGWTAVSYSCPSGQKCCKPAPTRTPTTILGKPCTQNTKKCSVGVSYVCSCSMAACFWAKGGNACPTSTPAKIGCTCRNGVWIREAGAVQCSDFQVGRPCTAATKPCATNGCSTRGQVTSCMAQIGFGAPVPGTKKCEAAMVGTMSCLRWSSCTTQARATSTPVVNRCTKGPVYCLNGMLYKCNTDKSGYTSTACGAGLTCVSGQSYCVRLTAAPTKPNATPTIIRCTTIENDLQCAYDPGCLWQNGACINNPRVTQAPRGTCSIVGKVECYQNNVRVCKQLSTGAMYWQTQACPMGCANNKCNIINTSPTPGIKACSTITNPDECAYTPYCLYLNGKCVSNPRVTPFVGSTCSTPGVKDCKDGNARICMKLSNGSQYWQTTACPFGCNNGVCLTTPIGCKCYAGKWQGTTCGTKLNTACTPTTPTPAKPVCANCKTYDSAIYCKPDGSGITDLYNCVWDENHKPKCVPSCQVKCNPVGQVVEQKSLLGCPVGTKRVCTCLSDYNWSCECKGATGTCLDKVSGTQGTRPDGTKVWLHFNDEASAKCVCGTNYHQNANGKWLCGTGGTGGNNTPTPGTGGQCTSTSTKPADICTPSKLSINPQCLGGKWDYDEQLCNLKGRKEVCGGKNYCCPAVNGSWTNDMTVCNTLTKCTECPRPFACYKNGSEYKWFVEGYVMTGFTKTTATTAAECGGVGKPTYQGKSKGDANCDGKISNADYSLWHKEFYDGDTGTIVKKTWTADFTGPNGVCDGKVTNADYSLWHKYFYELLNQ